MRSFLSTGANSVTDIQVQSEELTLSGSAIDIPIFYASCSGRIAKAIILYTEGSSADAGVVIRIGATGNDDYYYTGASETSKSLLTETIIGLLKTDVGAGDSITVGTAGGKVGAGKVRIILHIARTMST